MTAPSPILVGAAAQAVGAGKGVVLMPLMNGQSENPGDGERKKASGAPEGGRAWPRTPMTSTALASLFGVPPALTQGIQPGGVGGAPAPSPLWDPPPARAIAPSCSAVTPPLVLRPGPPRSRSAPLPAPPHSLAGPAPSSEPWPRPPFPLAEAEAAAVSERE